MLRRRRRERAMAHHHHHHGHGHHHGGGVASPASFTAAFAIGTALNLAFALAELGVGFFANSLALISDALHNFSDVIALLLAWCAACSRPSRSQPAQCCGWRRSASPSMPRRR